LLINDGTVIADGKFEELKTEQSATLEQLFAQLTGRQKENFNTDVLFNSFEEN